MFFSKKIKNQEYGVELNDFGNPIANERNSHFLEMSEIEKQFHHIEKIKSLIDEINELQKPLTALQEALLTAHNNELKSCKHELMY